MIVGAKVDQLSALAHGNTHWHHMARDARCQESALEAVIRRDHGPLPGILGEPAIGNGYLQCTSSSFNRQCLAAAESCWYTQKISITMQAACGLEARRHVGAAGPLVWCSRAQFWFENYELDQWGEVSQNRDALKCDIKALGRPPAEMCHNALPISVKVPDCAHDSLSFPAPNSVTSYELCDSGPSPAGQDLDHDKISQCPSLVSDSEDELEYSDFGTENERTWYTSEYDEGSLGIASTLTAYLLVHYERNASGSKDLRQSHTQDTGSEGHNTRHSRDDHSSCSSRTTPARKRDCHHCSGDQKSADGSGDDGRKRQKRVPHSTDDRVHGAGRLLACPFYKYDRRRYSEFNHLEREYRGCSSVYMTSIPRLK